MERQTLHIPIVIGAGPARLTTVFDRNDAPSHLFSIPELDFSEDLFAERLGGPWFRLGAWTINRFRDERGVEDEVSRQSIMLTSEGFESVFDKLESVGNVIGNLGKPVSSVFNYGTGKLYGYAPFHKFEFPFTKVVGEPLAFVHFNASGVELFINPDLWMFLELEEKAVGIWWDPKRGVEALRSRRIQNNNLAIVEVRREYLLDYLKARQVSLLVGHYRHLYLFNPSPETIAQFVKEDLILGSADQGSKAILQNWGLRVGIGAAPFLQRRLHLWFQVTPPEINIEDPWADEPHFDAYAFTLPTRDGQVAPARWTHFPRREARTFEGEICDFMDRVYFRQEVLTKYEGSSGFSVADDGSVRCHYWGLIRSTSRLGNELLATAIGDFAEGVPFDEWPHWKQYAVDPPSRETAATLREEQTVSEAVNSLVAALQKLNSAFACMAASLGLVSPKALWVGSLDSLAGRQLKWVYPATADDDEFLKRATLASTLVFEALDSKLLRNLLDTICQGLHLKGDPPRSLGSRNLLQRLTLVALLIGDLQPNIQELPMLVNQADGKVANPSDSDLSAELARLNQRIRDDFAPLAFLYDLRTSGGLTHAPNKTKTSMASARLGLPKENWHRTHYLQLLNLVVDSIRRISAYLDAAAYEMEMQEGAMIKPLRGLSEQSE